MKKLTVAIAGLGSRGNGYAACCAQLSDRVEIVAGADLIADKRERFRRKYHIADDMMFDSAEEMLERGRLADIMFICTMDRQHYKLAIPALRAGYHLLLEKPASPVPAECEEIARVAHECDRQVVVCHVLRYTPFYGKLREIMQSGAIGRVLSIQANEQVSYWHQAHSFVRGNWRNSDESSPMLLQKCCHDMDILLWLTGKHCKTVSSFGTLSHFKSENAPAGAPERCSEACPVYKTCPYSIESCYLRWAEQGEFDWPINVVEPEPSVEKLRETLKTSPYGRCVYHCDNNVVDHQVVNLLLEDDITVSFSMCAFTSGGGRKLHVMGTMGDILADMNRETIVVTPFAGESVTYTTATDETDEFGHGGGDFLLVRDLLEVVSGEENHKALTSIDDSIESHIVALACEESRLNNGKAIALR